jgi:hypothetical protein
MMVFLIIDLYSKDVILNLIRRLNCVKTSVQAKTNFPFPRGFLFLTIPPPNKPQSQDETPPRQTRRGEWE